jgi:hypothetical protein
MTQTIAKTSLRVLPALALTLAALTGCNGTADGTGTAGNVLGTDPSSSPPASIPTNSQDPGPGTPPSTPASNVIGASCQSSDSNHLCVALKYVVYTDSSSRPAVSQAEAIGNVSAISQEWSKCNIGFQIEEYDATDPGKAGLRFNTANDSDLDPIRSAYQGSDTFLVVTTGTWDRSGTLGNTGANAWTNMPGSGLYGAILESPVGTYPLIIAHELGHYMNLGHVSDQSDLMNPIIYDTSTKLTTSQCNAARSAVNYYWKAMKR